MDTFLKSFFTRLALFSIFTMMLLLCWQQYAPVRFQSNLIWGIYCFFILVTALIHRILLKAEEESPKKFVTYFMAITGVKLMTYLMIILIYALFKGKAALGFIMIFLVLYFLYTAFEVITLLKHFQKKG